MSNDISDERLDELITNYGPRCRTRGSLSRQKPSIRGDTYATLRSYKSLRSELAARDKTIETLREDADRYRWLRDAKSEDFPATDFAKDWWTSVLGDTLGEDFDAAIDAARSEEGKP